MQSRRFITALAAVGLAAALSAAVLAQGTNARLDGYVKDASAAIVPGADVVLINENTNLTYQTVSNDSGFYVFSTVTPGTYTLSCEMPGFKRYEEKGIKLDVGATETLNFTLETGELTDTVTVTSAVTRVDHTSQAVKNVITEKEIIDLPLVDKDPMNLFYLQAGTNRANQGFGGGRVDGMRSTHNNVQVEGITSMSPMLTAGASVSTAPIISEAISEYKVTTSSAAAEDGLGSGAQVQLIYKSGTNQFHGSVWEFHRNRSLNANDFFNNRQGIVKPAFLRHQYGAAVGGPIVRDKAFFHFTFERQTQKEDATLNDTVYTDAFKNSGVFQFVRTDNGQIDSIDLTTVDPTRAPGIHPAFQSFAGSLPAPNNTDQGDGLNTGGFRYSSDNPLTDWRLVLKGDYVLSTNHRFGVTYADRRLDNPGVQHISGNREFLNNEKYPAGIFTFTSTFSPTFLNELRLGGTKRDWKFDNGDPARFTTIPLLNFNGLGGQSRGGNANPSIFLPQQGPSATLTINDVVTLIRGDHTFKGGADIRINRSNVGFGGDHYLPVADTNNAFNPFSIMGVDGISSTDLQRAQQLGNDVTASLGLMLQTFQQISPDGNSFVPFETKFRRWRSKEYSFFFQDTWKFRPNLTLQLGFRYEVLPSAYEGEGIFSYPVSGGQGCVECLFGISGPGETQLGLLPEGGRELYDIDWNNFAPNLGFTWDPWGDGKWSIAGNYRIAYDRNPLVNTLFQDFSQEGASAAAFVFGQAGQTFSDAQALLETIDPGVPFGPKPFNRQGTITVWDGNYTIPYVQSWSLRIQREIMRNTVLEVAYVGNHGVGLPRAVDINQLRVRETGFLDGFLAAQANLAANGDPLIGADTGVFGQIWSVMTASDQASQISNIQRGEVASMADFIDRSRAFRGYLQAAGLPLNFFRANPQFNRAWLLGQNSHSTYNGLKLDVRRRFSDGLQFQVNYTFSKALTDYEGGQSQRNSFRDNANRRLDKSRASIDATHIFNSNFLYKLPFGRGERWANFSSGVLDAIFGGWQLNGILHYSSGQPVTIFSGGRNNLTLGDSSTVTFAGDDPGIASSVITDAPDNIKAFTDEQLALFSHPVAGSAGLTAQRFFNDASFWVLDGSIFKNFRTPWFAGEDSELQFRAEFFNLTNSPRFNQFNNNFSSASFGNINSTRDARIIQVALKFIF